MPVHLGTVAVDGAAEPIAQELADCRRRAAEADCKDGKRGSHGRPQPSPGGTLFGRRLVHEDLRLIGQGAIEFQVGLCQRLGDLVLHLDRQGRATGLAEQIFKEQCGPPLALPKVCHQQSRERHEPRSRLAGRHSRRQCRTGCFAPARASEPMPLVFRHKRLDLGQFPDLMPQRGGIRSREPRCAPPACGGLECFRLVAVCRRNQRPIVLALTQPAGQASASTSVASAAPHADVGCLAAGKSSAVSSGPRTAPIASRAQQFSPTKTAPLPGRLATTSKSALR